MEQFSSKSSEDNAIGGNQHIVTESFAMPGFSPQFSGPVYVSFPPPPCIPAPMDHAHQMTTVQDAQNPPSARQVAPENFQMPNQQYCTVNPNETIDQITGAFSTNLTIDNGDAKNFAPMSRPESVESPAILDYPLPPYSFVLPSGAFIHHFGGSMAPQLYQQFSPALPPTVPMHQFHQMYSLNGRDSMQPKAPYIPAPARHVVTPEPTQDLPQQVVPNAVYTSQLPEGAWSVHPTGMPGNPPAFYWGHYVHSMDKAHNIPFASQPFLRRQSICEESVVTPTNVCPPCNIAGIVSATPEFIHPRKPDVPQWLMSPPVGEQDPSIISYAPMMYRNVRVPSVTGMGIPVMAPVGSTVPVGNSMNGVEPRKLDSPALLLSPIPCYENLPHPQNINSEIPQEQVCDPPPNTDPNNQMKILPQALPPVTLYEQYKLMTPDEFLHSSERFLSPLHFDSGYNSSKCENGRIQGDSTRVTCRDSKNKKDPSLPELREVANKPDAVSNYARTEFFRSKIQNSNKLTGCKTRPDEGIIANLKKAAEALSISGLKQKPGLCDSKSSSEESRSSTPSAQKETLEKRSGKLKVLQPHNKSKTHQQHSCCHPLNKKFEALYTHLLNAAINLSAASGLLCQNKFNTCTKHNARNKNGLKSCGVAKGLTGPPLFKRVIELQQQQHPQCWQCAVNDKTPEVKHPTPDLFNRWPNIPPPPAPPLEGENCREDPCVAQLSADALPLAAALFQNEPNECCQNNGISQPEEDPQMPQTYPIGVFWDIENCAVPTGKSALSIVQRVRERFFAGHKEAEYMCVCDINKENKNVIRDLNHAQVNVVHISATAKNAADEKLRQSIRRFAYNHPAPATLVLITGDTNFTAEVSDLRHRHKYFVVLIHPANASPALLQAATTVICYEQLVADLPVVNLSPKDMHESPQSQILVSNLPRDSDANAIRNRLRQISDNCGGRVVKLSSGTAVLKFANMDAANRALKRLEGEDVFGYSINVSILRQSPRKSAPCRNNKNFSNNNMHYSPNRHMSEYQPITQEFPSDNLSQQDEFKPSVKKPPPLMNDESCKSTVNLTPGHCDPPVNTRSRFVPISENNQPSASVTSFSMLHPSIPPPCSISNLNPSPNLTHHGYNSMPPPPQPQLFQPPLQHRKEDNQQIGVKMTISNIDAQLGINTIQDILWKQITDHCQILDMRVRPHNRFTVVCDVTVPRVGDASRVLQHLQRQKIGSKRVLVTLTQPSGDDSCAEDTMNLKRECFSVLRENRGGGGMPLFKFLNMYEKRYQRKAKMDEIRQIQDVVIIHDGPGGITIFLNPKIKDEQSFEQHLATFPRSGRSTPDINHDFLLPVCKLHYPADAPRPPSVERAGGLLKIEMGLREFSAKLHALLHSHNGILQLDGFEYCYRAEYGNFPVPRDIHEGGVVVEHQASYVPGVQIIISQPHCLGVKAIVWAQPQSDAGSDTASDTSGASRWKSPNLIQFSREVVELLKDRPFCCLPYDSFNSAYHRRFGRGCRVSDYGFTRLSDLLTAIPHVLQIMGSLSNRILTLTHRAQVKRFTQEVVKILKTTPDRAILVAQMPELYNRTFKRAWRLRDYGVSVLSDLLDDIPEGHICTIGEGDNIVLSLPVRERTAEERERTNQFAREVIKILRSRPHYRMPFTDFVPTYHRQFGRQCKLANYGFSKLIDLFEALPHVVQVVEKSSEKILALTETEQLKILSMQITSILRAQQAPNRPHLAQTNHGGDNGVKSASEGPSLPLACIPALFQQKYNFPLIPQDLGASDLDVLVKKLSHAVKVKINITGDKMLCLAERKPLRLLSAQLLALLLDQSSDQLDTDQLHLMYLERYKESIEPSEYGFLSLPDIIRKALPGVVKLDLDASECIIHLSPLYKEARMIRSVLLNNNGNMTIGEFNFAYRAACNSSLDSRRYGFQSCEALLRALPNVLVMKGFGLKKTLTLRNHMQYGPLSGASGNDDVSSNGLCASVSMENLQTSDAPNSHSSLWVPDVYPAPVPPYWTDKGSTKNLVNSASMGDFKSEEEKSRREKMGQAIVQQPPGSWIPSSRPVVPAYSGSYYFQYSRPSSGISSHMENPVSHQSSSGNSPHASASPACSFTLGEISSSATNIANQRTPMRRGVSVSVITLPNGSTPIASTSSCSSSSPGSVRSSRSSESSDDYTESCSSDENCHTENDILHREKSRLLHHGVSSLPNSPFARLPGTVYVGALPSVSNSHSHSDNGSPGRIHLAASFPTLAHT